MKLAAAIIAPWVFFYMAGSFIGMQFNPVEWDAYVRMIYVSLSTFISVVIYTLD